MPSSPSWLQSASNYFTEQLLTILVCGLIGFAAIQMYRTDRLGFLATQFQKPVLFGGIGIMVLVVVAVDRRLEGSGRDAGPPSGCAPGARPHSGVQSRALPRSRPQPRAR